MIIHSNTPTSKVEVPPSLLDMVSERSSKAMYQSNRNKSAISSDESAIRNHNKQINKINNELPKNQSKTAYIYDTECVFDKYYDGTVLANVTTESGTQIPCVATVEGNLIKVTFEPLDEVALVNITTL